MGINDWQTDTGIAATPQWTCSETPSDTMAELPPRPKATRGHRQAVAEIGLRYRPSNAADMEAHRLRLELLACDLSEISPALIRAAGDRVAQSSDFMPKASEILAAAREIVAERQRAPRDGIAISADGEIIAKPQPGDKVAAYHAANRLALNNGSRVMQADDGELFRLGDPGERRGVRSDGSAIVPWFHHNKGDGDTVPNGWYCKHDDVAALSDCYRQHAARFVLRGAMIVERGA